MKISLKEVMDHFYMYDFDVIIGSVTSYRSALNTLTGKIEHVNTDEDSNDYNVQQEHIILPCKGDFNDFYWTIEFIKNTGLEYYKEFSRVFNGRGKYRKLKDALAYHGMLDMYHDYIEDRIVDMIKDWASGSEIELVE